MRFGMLSGALVSRLSLVLLVGLLVGCGSPSAPAPTAASAPKSTPAAAASPAKPASAASPAPAASPAKPSSAASPAPAASADWQAGAGPEWQTALDAAKREGTVVVAGSPNPDVRRGVTEGFERDTGIKVEYVSTVTASDFTAKLNQEAAAGKISTDVYVSGWPGVVEELPAGLLTPLRPKLLLPTVSNPANWHDGRLLWTDTSEQYMLRIVNYVTSYPVVNAGIVKPEEIKTWQDLLKPEYKGKIAAFDPRPTGPGNGAGVFLTDKFGEDFARRFWVGQGVVLTRDARQLAEWVARGTHPIGISVDVAEMKKFRADGFKLEAVFPEDGPGVLTSGFGIIRIFKDAPHPNASVVYANWMASPRGVAIYQQALGHPSLRKDVAWSTDVPEWIIPKPGLKYIDQNEEQYIKAKMRPMTEKMIEILGR